MKLVPTPVGKVSLAHPGQVTPGHIIDLGYTFDP